jgi:hypothetical protein
MTERQAQSASEKFHSQAMLLVDQISQAYEVLDAKLARTLSRKVARLEERALRMTPVDRISERAILGVSAVSFYYQAGDYKNTVRLAAACLENLDPSQEGSRQVLQSLMSEAGEHP